MAKSGSKQTKHSKKFKTAVIMDMRKNHLGKRETVRKHWQTNSRQEEDLYVKTLKRWERIYMKEGAAGLMTERRGRKSTGRPRKKPLDKEIENDLIAENQRLKERNQYLEAELEYLKKLDALVRAEEQKNGKKQ